MDSHPLLQGAFNAWLKQEEYSYVLHGKDLTDYYKAQAAANFKLPDSQSLITANEDLYQYYFLATFQAGGLFAFRETAFPDEAKKVMKPFAFSIFKKQKHRQENHRFNWLWKEFVQEPWLCSIVMNWQKLPHYYLNK